MKNAHTKHLLEGLPLRGSDAARLVLEAVEEMPELRVTAARGRAELMQALRRVLREGIAGVRATTLRDLRHFIRRLLRVPGLAERPLRAMGVVECRQVLEAAFAGSAHSYRKGRAVLHSVFAYGMRQGWCAEGGTLPAAAAPVAAAAGCSG